MKDGLAIENEEKTKLELYEMSMIYRNINWNDYFSSMQILCNIKKQKKLNT